MVVDVHADVKCKHSYGAAVGAGEAWQSGSTVKRSELPCADLTKMAPPTSRRPYPDRQRKLILAFDIGTTFSGVSYAFLDPGAVPTVEGVTR